MRHVIGLLDHLTTESDLEARLSAPSDADVACCRRIEGDVLVLGAAGKTGPSLVQRIVRATGAAGVRRRVVAVSRFSSASSRELLESVCATTITADLLDTESLEGLPDCPNVLYSAGRKSGPLATCH